MAKNKKKKKQPSAATSTSGSPERYIRQAARKLPIYKCYISPDWREAGEAHVIVSRINQRGDIVAASYLVDLFCLGVKQTYWNIVDEKDLQQFVGDSDQFVEISYPEVHNLILGAIEFAEEAGIEPAADFALTQYVLSEDTDDIELIEYEYGYQGKHHLVIGEDGAERKFLSVLEKNLGDNYTFSDFSGEYDDDEEYDGDEDDYEYEGYPELRHHYDYPEYPAEPAVKNPFLLDILYNPDAAVLEMADIDKIMALPYDELCADIDTIVRYEIGRTYQAIADGQAADIDFYHVLRHCLAIIIATGQPENFATVRELVRQSDEFVEEQLGYEQDSLLPEALYRTCGNDLSKLEDLLDEHGMTAFSINLVLRALCLVYEYNPDRRYEVQEILRRLLVNMVDRLPETDRCNPLMAGFVLELVSGLHMTELLDEVKAVLATGYVDADVIGTPADYLASFGTRTPDIPEDNPNIYDYYTDLRQHLNS